MGGLSGYTTKAEKEKQKIKDKKQPKYDSVEDAFKALEYELKSKQIKAMILKRNKLKQKESEGK